MLIHVAENGLSFELDCQATTSVEDVQSYLVSLTGVLQHEQLLIVGDTRLEAHRTLGFYNLPADDDGDRAIFLFSRHRLSPDCPPPQAEFADRFAEALGDPLLPPPPPPPDADGQCQPLDESRSRDPALRALPSYERQFKYHLDKGRGILVCSQKKLEACRTLLREQQVQEMALETARANMEHYYKMIDQLYHEFVKQYTRQQRQHGEVLATLDRDLEKLRLCKLHPALRSECRNTLMDCVKERSLRKWADECALSHKQFFAKVSQLKSEYVILQRSVEDLLATGCGVDVSLLEETIDKHMHYAEEQASIMQSLSKDVNTVRRLIDDCTSSQQRPHDAVSALGPMYEVHDKSHLPRMEACNRELCKLLDTCRRSKNTMSMGVHLRMQSVAALQASIRDMRNQLSAFKEAMARQDDIFEELKVVRKVGLAYKACLAEVVRRKACMKIYMGQAGQLAEKLARKREMEITRREEFFQVQSLYIPRDVLAAMGLVDTPSQCTVNIAPFDVGLLDIDMADLERYAPESLLGALYKVAEGAPASALLGSDDGGLDEIVGTSKLEVENTWLKAELASAVSMLCALDPEYQPEELEEYLTGQGDSREAFAARKTAEALQLKDLHAKQLQGMLDMRQQQCQAYEKRIRELEETLRAGEGGGLRRGTMLDLSEDSGLTTTAPSVGATAEPMDEGTTSSKLARLTGSSCTEASDQIDEGLDENMVVETEAHKGTDGEKKVGSDRDKEIAALRAALSDKVRALSALEEKLKEATATSDRQREEVECGAELLRECQMNCAHLENRLHGAREEARTNLCASERRAAEYASLRASSVRLRGLLERLNNCITAPVDGPSGFVESLSTLSSALSSSSSGGGGDGENRDDPYVLEFQAAIRILADRVAGITQQMMERCSSLEAAQAQLNRDAESKSEMLKKLYAKHKVEKQARKEKICFTHFEIHELAVFMPNPARHWEALNRNCPNYYLSDESIALFLENLPSGQRYIVGQIVHINRNVARSAPSPPSASTSAAEYSPSSPPGSGRETGAGAAEAARSRYNPYGLPVGSVYFVVTVAMVPDLLL